MEKGPFKKFGKQRRRTYLFVFIGLIIVAIGGFVFFGVDSALLSNESSVEESAETPEGASEEESDEEQASEEEEPAPIAPDNPTMYLSIPKLGISNAIVIDDVSEEWGLRLGAGHLPGTGFPWIPGSNTYIAGHRIGYPGTPSDHIFYNLPSMEPGDEITLTDSLGQVYRYQVSEVFTVTPFDLSVIDAVEGRDMVTLQTCTETLSDWWTIGPRLMSSGPESGRLVVRADRV